MIHPLTILALVVAVAALVVNLWERRKRLREECSRAAVSDALMKSFLRRQIQRDELRKLQNRNQP